MGLNCIAACEAAPGTGTPNIAFPADDRYSRLDNNDAIKITDKLGNKLVGLLYSAESTGARALLRQPGEIDKSFLKCCVTTDNDPTQGYHDHYRFPVNLLNDKLEALSVNATDEDTIIGMLLANGHLAPGPFTIDEIIDGYSDTTVTQLTWHDCPITWNQDLKEGIYSVVGMRASIFLAANLWTGLMRLDIPGNQDYKPGVPATLSEADHEELQSQTNEPWVIWGDIGVNFKAPEEMPNVEVCSLSAVTDENIQLMLMKK